MTIRNPKKLTIAILFLLIFIFLLSGLAAIPFHPDETTVLYQSRDLELFLSKPALLFWDVDNTEQEQTYRLLNPPLPKYIVGFARVLSGSGPEAVDVDWNWQQTWTENQESGAVPDRDILTAGRAASAIFLFLALIPLSLTAKRLGGESLIILTLLLFGAHALILLHGRRSMSEGVLIFSVSLAIYGFFVAQDRPVLAGFGVALAVSSKLSVAPLLVVGLVASIWRGPGEEHDRRALLGNILRYSATAVFVLILLNPIVWANPIRVASDMWNARIEFLNSQIETLEAVSPEHILRSPVQRTAAMIYHLFITPPQTAEVANYVEATERAVEAYLAKPMHTIARNRFGGILHLILFTSGVGFSLVRAKGTDRRNILLLSLATFVQALALLWANPLPFQRYYMPMVPFIILWIAIGLQDLIGKIKQTTQNLRWPAKRFE